MNGTKTMHNFPKVTVVTVTYNAEKYLENTIKSVLEQDYPHVEYIIIDGASTDGTLDIIKKYEKNIDYWISELDSGIYDAMNKGIDVATGEWINFMNAGDSFCENSILGKIFTQNISEENYDVLYGAVNIVDKQLNTENIVQAKPMKYILKGSYCNHQSMFVKSSIMKKLKFNLNYKLAAEKDLFTKLYLEGYSYKILDFPISNFIITIDSLSFKHRIVDSIEMLYILSRYIDEPLKIYQHNHYKRLKSYEPKTSKLKLELSKDISKIYLKAFSLSEQYKNILLYGYGSLSKMLLHIFRDNNITIVDKNKKVEDDNVFALDKIKEAKYDIVIITILGREEEVSSTLQQCYGIPKEKIISL